jgi:hypothetical protein
MIITGAGITKRRANFLVTAKYLAGLQAEAVVDLRSDLAWPIRLNIKERPRERSQ